MSVIAQAEELNRQGRTQQAINLILQAARTGDAEGLFAVANWRLWGLNGPRDLTATHALLTAAGERGHADSILLRATLTANGNGVPADWAAGLALLRSVAEHPAAAKQLRLIEAMAIDESGAPRSLPAIDWVSEEPKVGTAEGLLSADECSYLMVTAAPRLEPSLVTAPNGERIPNPVRTSDGAGFGPAHEDLVVRAINRRLAAFTGTDVRCGEPLHMLRYRPGQEYKPHIDPLPGQTNQRSLTVLLYLNDRYQGGQTAFVETGLTLRPGIGGAVVFDNLEADGRPDKSTQHAGLAVTSGIKWLATRWIRQQPYHPWGIVQS